MKEILKRRLVIGWPYHVEPSFLGLLCCGQIKKASISYFVEKRHSSLQSLLFEKWLALPSRYSVLSTNNAATKPYESYGAHPLILPRIQRAHSGYDKSQNPFSRISLADHSFSLVFFHSVLFRF